MLWRLNSFVYDVKTILVIILPSETQVRNKSAAQLLDCLRIYMTQFENLDIYYLQDQIWAVHFKWVEKINAEHFGL